MDLSRRTDAVTYFGDRSPQARQKDRNDLRESEDTVAAAFKKETK